MAHDVGDISVFSLATLNQLAYFEDVTYTIDETQVNGAAVQRAGMSPNGTKLGAKISTNLLSTYLLPDRVSHLDLSAFAIGGDSFLGTLRNVEVSGSFTQKMKAGVGAWYKRPQNVTKDYKFSVELDCEQGVAAEFMIAMHSTTHADRDVNVSLTLNGTPVTIPGRIQQVEHSGKRDDLQTLKLSINGKDPGVGNYPTAPSGTATLLQKAFNAWKDPIGFAYTSHATQGFHVEGAMVFGPFSFRVEDEALVKNQFAFDSHGVVVASATTS